MIHNINIVKSIDNDNTPGLNNITPEQMFSITNSFVKNIDCTCLDSFPLVDRNNLFVHMHKKLCVGGSMSIKIVNPSLLANKIYKSELNGQKMSEILAGLLSVWTIEEAEDIINQLDLKIQGIYYENIYTIYQLNK